MISAFQEIENLFREIGSHLSKPVNVFTIGGAVLLYQGLKPATKDIDVVVFQKHEFSLLTQALKECHFVPKRPELEYLRFNLSEILVREDFRIDLFHHKVCGAFFLSPPMMKRAQLAGRFGHLSFYLCANEDIFLFKSMTEREGDLDDSISLAKRGLQWEIILNELRYQVKETGNNVWVTWVGERFDLLVERGLPIPIMKEIDALRLEYYQELERKLNQK